tara:strand:+ start:2057 stop:2812 length:756 start_codon:yes stop_codon:yes gene_type:complete
MAIGKKVGPARFIGAVMGVAGGVMNMIGGGRAARKARKQQRIAQAKMQKREREFEALDTSNLYADVQNQYTGMENVMEDLTVNQQQAQFEAQQGAQQRANIMETMRGAAGGSGIAALAQTMAMQGQLATQQASASIGEQEAANQKLMAEEAAKIQLQEREGEAAAEAMRLEGATAARDLERQKTEGLMGLASGQLQSANQAVAAAQAQKRQGLSQIVGGVASGLTGGIGGKLMGKLGGAFDKTRLGTWLNK